jgi:nitrate reductase (NAD(P)H)
MPAVVNRSCANIRCVRSITCSKHCRINGEELTPDHGYPVRIIIPGYIGGRMVKWLTTIHVSSEESDNHYHFFDNRVLPPKVDAERALAEGWWYKPQYIINELNINSAVNSPQHAEVLPLSGPSASSTYTVSGYAYAGGGLAINRAEVSFDGGETWELCDQQCPEKPRHMGKYWCWTFWSYKVRFFPPALIHTVVMQAV